MRSTGARSTMLIRTVAGQLSGHDRARHPRQRQHPALDRRPVDGEDALLRDPRGGHHRGGGDQAGAGDHHPAHLERGQCQRQREQTHLHGERRDRDEAASPGGASTRGGRRRLGAARVPALAGRRLQPRPGPDHQAGHRSRGVDDQRRLGTDEGDVARALVEHLGAHESGSVRWGQCMNAG